MRIWLGERLADVVAIPAVIVGLVVGFVGLCVVWAVMMAPVMLGLVFAGMVVSLIL